MPKLDDFEPSGLSAYGQNIAENKRGALGAGLASGFEDIKGLGYNAAAAIADVAGADEARAWLEQQAKEKEYRSFIASRPELERVEDQTLGSALPFAGYQIMKQVPNVVGAIGMGVLTPEVAVPAALSRAGALLPRALGGGGLEAGASYATRRAAAEAGETFGKQIVGGAAFNEGQAVGSLYQSAREGGDAHAGRTALLASPAYALAETLPEAMLVGRVTHGSGFTGNLLQRTLKAGTTQGAAGATSELIQTGMEQAVGKELTPEEARSQYLNAGVIGGMVEGVLGLSGGIRRGKPILPGANQSAAATPDNTPSGEVGQAFQANDRTTPDSIMSGLVGRAADPLAGRSTLYGQQAPAVTGGETEIAQAQQQAQAEAQQIQAAQQQQAAREQIYTDFNIADPQNPTKGNLFGKPLFGRNVPAVADAVGATVKTMTPYQLEVAQAVNKANAETGGKLLNFQFNANDPAKSVQKAFDAIAKVAVGFQIADVQSTQEAAQILDEQSKTLSGTKLEQLNAIHFALTGEDTSGYTAAQQSKAEKGAKNGKLQQQTTTGLGTVPVEGGTGEANAGGAGPVRSTEVQPIGATGLGEGSLGLQTGQPPAGGVRAGTSADTGLGNGQPTQNTQVNGQTQTTVSGAPQVTTERQTDENLGSVPSVQQEQAVEEQQVEGVPGLIRAALRMIYKSDRKVDLLLRLTEKTQRGDYAALAKEYDVSEQYVKELASDAITDEGEQFPRFITKNIDKFMAAVNAQAEQSGISVLEALDALQTIHDAYEGGEAAQLGTEVNEADISAAGLAIQNREERTDKTGKGTGKSDLTNVTNIVDETDYRDRSSQAYLEEMDAFDKDPSEKNRALLDAAAAAASAKNNGQAKTLYQKYQVLKGTRNAVQEQSTDEGNVREPAGGGEAVGEGNAKPQKPARKAKQTKTVVKPTEAAPQVKTAAEQWAELADQFPGMPPYESLTQDEKDQWDDLASRGVANLAAANRLLESAVQARATEAPSATGDAQTLAPQVEKLTEGQTARLEKHYGVKRGTQEFLAKLGEDVVLYASKGAEAVAAAIRDIVKVVAEGVLAMAMVVNPNLTYNKFEFNLPQVVTQTTELRAAVPAEAKTQLSEAAQVVYTAVAPIAKKAGKAFMITDKADGKLHVFHADGSPLSQTAALVGRDKGDQLQGGKGITPAGQYTIRFTPDAEYAGGFRYDLVETSKGGGIIAIHAVYTGEALEQRPARLASATSEDNRISWGCINVSNETMVDDLIPAKGELNGSLMFVMPENSEDIAELFPALTETTTKTEGALTAKTNVRDVVGKEEKMLFGKDGAVKNPYTVAELTKEISDFVRTVVDARKLKIVGSVKDLLTSDNPDEQQLGAVLALNRAYGVAANGRAYLIADRISKGQGRAKFLHEVGAHLGIEGLLTDEQFDDLTDQIFAWAQRDDNSREAQLAIRAILRADAAQTPDEDLRSEVLAYFVEEATQAGIEPSAVMKLGGPLGKWFRTLYAAFKAAVRRLGMNPEKLNAQDVVNMAYGAARLEMAGTYHGTAAEFRRFNHKYMGTGEGAQAYGWGTYLAQSFGVAKGYWQADVARKSEPERDLQVVPANGKPFNKDEQQALSLIQIGGLYTNNWASKLQDVLDRTTKSIVEAQSSLDAVRAGLRATRLPVWRYEQEIARLEKVKRGAESLLTPGRAAYGKTAGYTPEGNLMRVDVGVAEHEMLDWETTLSQQPEVLEKIEANMSESVRERLEDAMNASLDELTGEWLYRGLQGLEKEEGLISEQFPDVEDYNKRLSNSKSKRIVSAYLDEVLGVPALKFLDQDSRGDVGLAEAKLKNKQQLLKEKEKAAKEDRAYADKWDAEYTNAPPESFKEQTKRIWLDAVERATSSEFQAELLRQEIEEDKRRIRKLQNPTRNLVVFNDKNIFRVGSRGGNKRENMKFGIETTLPPVVLKPAKSVVTNLATAARNGLLSAGITEDIVNMAKKYMRSAGDYLDAQYARQKTRLEFEMRIERIEEAFERLPKELQGTGANSVNRYILDSTMQRKWGYYPGEHRIGTELFEVDPDLEKRFDAFPPAAQKVIRDVFEHGYTALKLKQSAVSKAVEREFAEREKAAIGDADMLAQLQKERKEMVARLTRLQNIDFTTPYAYLGRYGDYVVVAKSKEFKHWEERAKLNDFDREQAQGWLAENVSNPDHYVVQFVETQGEADQIASELIATGKYDMDGTEAGPKEDVGSYIGSDVHLAVARLRNLADRQQGEGSEELDKLLSDLYLLTAAENSARKSEFMRKYVSGADANMMRNLATSGRADAHFLSTMEHNDDITDAMERMRDEARNNRRDAMPLYNELFKRQTQSLNYDQPSTLGRALTQASSMWFLATSPAFYLQQILQTSVLSLPYMSGRLGYFRSVRAIKAAYTDVAELVKGVGMGEHIDFSKAPADVRQMLQTLVGMGKIDIGIDADTKARASEHGPVGKVMRKLQNLNSRIEAVNRATAAIAAYRGYIQRYGNNPDAATKYAAEVVSNTHGSYDGFNTPRILNSDVGRVVGQFKRFQIIQLSMLGKLINNAFRGASAEEKAVARRALAFIGGHMAVLGGALGVPFVQQIGSLMTKLLGDEDEPDDFEYKMRQMIGDKTMADLLLNGVPAALGVNLGGKLGMGNVASILPFTDVDLSSRSGYEKVMVGMMGPFFGGLAPKFIDGAGMIAKGEYYKGLELLAPNGIGNAMKGLRYANEGITMRNGDVVLKPEEISMLDAAFQAVGLPTTTITGRQYAQRTMAEFDKFYSDRAAEVKGAYVNANREGDTEGMADARQEWQKLQDSRRRNGYKIQPMSELFKATVAARKREAGVVGGVETSKSNKQFAANLI